VTQAGVMPLVSRATCRRGLHFACVLLALACAAEHATAQPKVTPTILQQPGGCVVELPSAITFSPRSGLRLRMDSRWPFSHGYRPVHIQITSDKPTTAAQRITVRLHVAAWDWHYLDVSQSFDMPLGATKVCAVIRCPQLQSDYRYWWDVWVDGVRQRDLSLTVADSWNLNASGSNAAFGNVSKFLLIGPAAKSQQMMNAGPDAFESITLTLAELPDHWLDFSAVDVVVLAPDDLKSLSQNRPEVLTALNRWLRTGGQIWVHPVGPSWERLEEVEQLLKLSPPATSHSESAVTDQEIAGRGWHPVEFRNDAGGQRITAQHIPSGRIRVLRDPTSIDRLRHNPDYALVDDPNQSFRPNARPPRWTDSSTWYVERDHGLGHIRAFRHEWDPVGFAISLQMLGGRGPGPPQPTMPITATLDTTRNWRSRHGMSPDVANQEFADFLVPGVGLAPVTEFRVLITLFVLVIGPLNFWLLMRANRLHLILFTVPLLALGLTAGLFAYAFVSDGLSSSVRARSFTTLDQSTGESATWARLSYYSGLAPSRGLELSDDVALYPIQPGWEEMGDTGATGITRKMEWAGDKQRLHSGWLRSRVPTQFLTVRARKSPHRLRVDPTEGKVSVTNELGTPITFLAVVDTADNVFIGSVIEDSATVTLTPSTHPEALSRLRELIAANQPETPPALVESERNFTRAQRRRRRMFEERNEIDYGAELLSENLLSEAIAALIETRDEPRLGIPPGSYVAVTEANPEVELGLPDVTEQASFHVVVGTWNDSSTPSPATP
jgi:hypothetical protein